MVLASYKCCCCISQQERSLATGVEDDMNDNGSDSDSSTYEKIDDDMHYMVPRNIVS